jgi:hypothetical protein
VSNCGDSDGDGIADVLVTTSAACRNGGVAEVRTGTTGEYLWGVSPPFGWTMLASTGIGDFDGDGVPDIATVTTDCNGTHAVTAYSGATQAEIDATVGQAVSPAGDANGDGLDDYVVGYPTSAGSRGSAAVRGGGGAGDLWTGSGENVGDRFGQTVAGGQDFDGDAVPDFVVSAPYFESVGSYVGKLYVYSGATEGLLYSIEGSPFPGGVNYLGESLAIGGDFNSDGTPDIEAGVVRGGISGEAFVFSGVDGSLLFSVNGDGTAEHFATALAPLDDVNDGGVTDLAVGAPRHDGDGTHGKVYVFSGADQSILSSFEGTTSEGSSFGISLAVIGDVNGNGSTDVVVGRSGFTVNLIDFAPPPVDLSVSPTRGHYKATTLLVISGRNFDADGGAQVEVTDVVASNIVVLDDATIQCDVGPSTTSVGDVVVTTVNGSGRLPDAFAFTPAALWDGDAALGESVTVHYLCDPKDGIYAIAGVPPEVNLPTPPYDGALCILPFTTLFLIPPKVWPFDEFTLDGDIPNDPTLSGLTVLLQALIGPSFSKPKDASWTNCASLTIQ